MPFNLGWVELLLVLVIVAMLFGVGKLPEVFGAVGKGIREFRKESGTDNSSKAAATTATTAEPAELSEPVEKSN
jgi:sec-independent protein translocase protein TatA